MYAISSQNRSTVPSSRELMQLGISQSQHSQLSTLQVEQCYSQFPLISKWAHIPKMVKPKQIFTIFFEFNFFSYIREF